jgi:hypothetical protein
MTDKSKKTSASGASNSLVEAKLSDDEKVLDDWLKLLYASDLMNKSELESFYEKVQYQGFNRKLVLKQLHDKVPEVKVAAELIIAIAVRGPQVGSKQKLSSGRTPTELGIPASGQKGTKTLTCNKIQAATADLAAAYLKRLNVPKRLPVDCPAWLQFPSAASIKMPENLRKLHVEFARTFSGLIGGVFNEQIYALMVSSAYLDETLGLFA